jgi:hypothetical protein
MDNLGKNMDNKIIDKISDKLWTDLYIENKYNYSYMIIIKVMNELKDNIRNDVDELLINVWNNISN